MRTSLQLGAFALALAIATMVALPAVADDVNWTSASYEEALEQANATNSYVLIDFYTTWCGPCKKLDKETYADASVIEFIDGMIPIKLDSEKGEGIEVSKHHRVAAWPTIMLLDSNGKEIDRIVGFVDAEEFIQTIGDYQKGINTIAYLEKHVKNNPDDAEAWKTLGTKYADAVRGPEANAAFEKYLKLRPDISGEEKAEALYSIGEAYYVDHSYEKAAEIFEGVVADYPQSEWHDRAITRLARAYYGLGKVDKCVATYKAYADRHPNDPRACNSFAWFCATKKVGLDEALPVALRAVELTERDPGYLDTLAELYYARGEFDKAIEIGQEALDKEPGDQYFTDQVKKFKAAKEEADKRASK